MIEPAGGRTATDVPAPQGGPTGSGGPAVPAVPGDGLAGVLRTVRSRWRELVLVAALFAAGAVAYAATMPDEYAARAVIAVEPPAGAAEPVEQLQLTLPLLQEYGEAPATVHAAAAEARVSAAALERAVDVSVENDATISVEAVLTDRERAAAVANAVAGRVVAFAREHAEVRAEVVAPAVPPASAEPSGRTRLAGAGIVAGFVLAFALALALDRLSPRVRSWRELAPLTGHRLLGRVPERPHAQPGLDDEPLAAAARALRAAIEPALRGAPGRPLLVTAATRGEGSTTVARVLAEAFARSGADVLLVDADLGRPALAGPDRADAVPLARVLAGEVKLSEATRSGGVEGLTVLPVVREDGAADALVRRFDGLVAEAGGRHDVVVVDAAPLSGEDTSLPLAANALVVLVVAVGASVDATTASVAALEGVGATVVGVVANRVPGAFGARRARTRPGARPERRP